MEFVFFLGFRIKVLYDRTRRIGCGVAQSSTFSIKYSFTP